MSDYEILLKHKATWQKKSILREIYAEWYQMILKHLSRGNGKTLELGAGSGNFKEFFPQAIATDIVECAWLDKKVDALDLPFAKNSLSNIVMIDVLHHLADPLQFFREASRTLKKGGRIIMIEPYPSFFSLLIYRRFHPEPFLFDEDYFLPIKTGSKKAWDSNQAIPYLIFFIQNQVFQNQFGDQFRIILKQRFSFLYYPLSGGFENKALIPEFLFPIVKKIEPWLQPLSKWIAFRCFIVIEKI